MTGSRESGRRRMFCVLGLVSLVIATTAATCNGRTEFLKDARPLCERSFPTDEGESGFADAEGEFVFKPGEEPVEPEGPQFPVPYNVLIREHDDKWFKFATIVLGEERPTEGLKTLVCIQETQLRKGTYSDGAKAYQYRWDVVLLEWPNGLVIHRGRFYGSEPSQSKEGVGSVTGFRPKEEFKSWLDLVFAE